MKDLSNKNIIHIKNENIEYLQFRKLLEYRNVVHHAYAIGLDVGFKTTTGNQKEASQERLKLANSAYKKLCTSIESDYTHIVQANQDHTDVIKSVMYKVNSYKPDLASEKVTIEDGLMTNKKQLMLATTNADCILLLFFDPIKKVIANTHSGWRGTLQRISTKTVQKMVHEFDCKPKDIICCICPSIRKCHFEVESDVKDMFEKEFQDLKDMKFIDIEEGIEKTIVLEDFIEKNLKWNIDTVIINKILLQKEGLKPENIIDSEICSVCNSDMIHSYRIEKQSYNTETAIIELQ